MGENGGEINTKEVARLLRHGRVRICIHLNYRELMLCILRESIIRG